LFWQEELNAMVDEIDQDGNGEIDFDGERKSRARARPCQRWRHGHVVAEFVTVMSRKVSTSYTPSQVKAAFKVFERDCPSGFVSMAALEQALTTYGSETLSVSDAQELLSQIEPDENGMVNYIEFVNMMTSSWTEGTLLSSKIWKGNRW
jgi:calmodulin